MLEVADFMYMEVFCTGALCTGWKLDGLVRALFMIHLVGERVTQQLEGHPAFHFATGWLEHDKVPQSIGYLARHLPVYG